MRMKFYYAMVAFGAILMLVSACGLTHIPDVRTMLMSL